MMSASVGTERQRSEFSSRLNRIAAGGVNTTRHVYVGPVDAASASKKRQAAFVKAPPRKLNFFAEMAILPFALILGAASILAGHAIDFHFIPDQVPDLAPMAASGLPYAGSAIGVLLALAFVYVFRLNVGERFKAVFAGAAAILLFEEIFAAQVPQLFAMIYSEPYVAEMIAKVAA
jgi:hypothetical protein